MRGPTMGFGQYDPEPDATRPVVLSVAIVRAEYDKLLEGNLAGQLAYQELKQQFDELTAKHADALVTIQRQQTALDGVVEETRETERRNQELQVKTFARFNNEECWIYQGEGDELESLVCPVVIAPGALLMLKEDAAERDALRKNSDAAKGLAQDMEAIAAGSPKIPFREYAMHALHDYHAAIAARAGKGNRE